MIINKVFVKNQVLKTKLIVCIIFFQQILLQSHLPLDEGERSRNALEVFGHRWITSRRHLRVPTIYRLQPDTPQMQRADVSDVFYLSLGIGTV